MQIISKKIKEGIVPIFILADIILIALSVLFSFMLRFDGILPADRRWNFYAFCILAEVFTVLIFFFQKIYNSSWRYVSITDLPKIMRAVISSTFLMGAVLFVFRDNEFLLGFPRSVLIIYAIVFFLLSTLLRFSKRIYWQIFKTMPFSKAEDFILPMTSGTIKNNNVKNILITGGAGYVGSVLSQKLLEEGYNVTVYDKLLFGRDSLAPLQCHKNFKFIEGDIFDSALLSKALLEIDAVIHLAAIVGEPACICQKDVALKTNYLGTIYTARLCKSLGIKRFIQASTCSTYGQNSEDKDVEEGSHLFPVDFYGETKIYAERELLKLIDEDFSVTILRFSTVYGISPRMRFDLVVNTLTKKAVLEKEITIFGGNQWRPLIHVTDVARAILAVLKSPLHRVANEIFNVGNTKENYIISDVGELVKKIIPEVSIKTIKNMDDKRNYKVDFSKIEKTLSFKTQKNVEDGIREIEISIKEGKFGNLEDKKYYNHLVL